MLIQSNEDPLLNAKQILKILKVLIFWAIQRAIVIVSFQSNSKSWSYIIENFLSGALYYLRVFGICQDNVFYISLQNTILLTGTHI